MNSTERIREKLRARQPFAKIRTEEPSISKLYEVTGQYLDEIEGDLERKRLEIAEIQHERSNLNAEVEALRLEREHLTVERAELSEKVDSTKVAIKQMTAQTARVQEQLDKLQTEMKTLEERGFTPEIMAKLRTANDKNGREVTDLLLKQEKAHELDSEIASAETEKSSLNDELTMLRERIRKLEKKVASKENKLDLLEARLAVTQQVVEVVKTAIRNGYQPQQIEAMLLLLKKLEIQGNPIQSIDHFLQCIGEAKNLSNLKHEACLAEKKLEELLKAEAEVRSRVEIAQNAVLSVIESARKEVEGAIASVETQATVEINKVASQSVDAIRTVGSSINEVMCRDIDKLDSLKKETGRLESWVEPARVLTGMIQSPEVLKTISPSFAIALLQNLAVWCDLWFPKADIAAMYDVASNEFRQNEFVIPRFQISSLVKLSAEAITRLNFQRLRDVSK